jgi:hypothetical protein
MAVPLQHAGLRGTVPESVWIGPLDFYDTLTYLFSPHLRKFERATFVRGMASASAFKLRPIAFEGRRQHRTVRHPVMFLVSTGHHSAVDRQYSSRDPGALVGCEEENSFRYVSRLADPSERVEGIEGRQNLRNLIFGKESGVDRRFDHGRGDGIDPDLIRSQFQRKIVN